MKETKEGREKEHYKERKRKTQREIRKDTKVKNMIIHDKKRNYIGDINEEEGRREENERKKRKAKTQNIHN